MTRYTGRNATGGTQAECAPRAPDEQPVAFAPPPSEADLLRRLWARRGEMSTSTRELVHGFLQRVQRRPLTAPELATAQAIGRRLGVGFDAPAELGEMPRQPEPQPWGPLPLKPPRSS